jgi:hypothetical protein
MGRPKKADQPIPVDWEGLAKNLQKSLSAEIKENDELKQRLVELEENESSLTKANTMLAGIIFYLEKKNGNDPI